MRHLTAIAALCGALTFSAPAIAGGIAVVDFQEAINQVSEGETARAQIDALYQQKQAAIANLEAQIQTKMDEYEKQRLILSDAARAAKEQELMQLQQTYQQAGMQAESEMQELYTQKMEALITKMRGISEQIGSERSYDLILEKTESGVVFTGVAVTDITGELIKRYDGN
ncbi:MAG: outer membrane protein [Myxococcota bacterium]|jgi:outer membrane protein